MQTMIDILDRPPDENHATEQEFDKIRSMMEPAMEKRERKNMPAVW